MDINQQSPGKEQTSAMRPPSQSARSRLEKTLSKYNLSLWNVFVVVFPALCLLVTYLLERFHK